MKKVISLLLAVLLCAAPAVTVCASVGTEYFVYDDADLLTDSEEYVLEDKLSRLSHTYNAQLIVVTISSLDGADMDEYLNVLYDEMGFGYGANYDGVLLLVCMDPREYRILSNGFAGSVIDSGKIGIIGEAFVDDLSYGNYADAFDTFADQCQYYLDGDINGFPFDVGKNLLIASVLGLVIALIVTGIWRGQLKSVRMQNEASVYVKPGSMQITQAGDFFMYRNVTRTARQQNNSSSGGRSGSSRSTGGGSF